MSDWKNDTADVSKASPGNVYFMPVFETIRFDPTS